MQEMDEETGPPGEDQLQDDDAGEQMQEEPRRPALVINVYSWATPVLAVVMLVLGLLGGYFGRPLIAKEAGSEEAAGSSQVVPTADPNDAARRQEMMDYLIGKVPHFKGDENAPVTIIEFSDYQ